MSYVVLKFTWKLGKVMLLHDTACTPKKMAQ